MKTKAAYIFDFDDTLIFTTAKIYVRKISDNSVVKSYSTIEYNNLENPELDEEHYYDYSEFKALQLLKNEKPTPFLEMFGAMVRAGYDCYILTSRQIPADIEMYLIYHSIPVNPNNIICTNCKSSEFTGADHDKKAQAIIKLHNKFGYTDFHIWEDSYVYQKGMLSAESSDISIHLHDVPFYNIKTMKPGKISGAHIAGTGVTIFTTYSMLYKLFGKPNCKSGDGKSNYIWSLVDDENTFNVQIYDWKLYRDIADDEIIEWNIGGKSHDAIEAKNRIKAMIKKLSKNG